MKLQDAEEATRAYLHAHGISVGPGHLNRLQREALSRHRAILYPPAPRLDLTREEIGALDRAGFDLDPARRAAVDPLAATASEFAAILEASLSTAQTARRLGVDPSRIRQRLISRPPTLIGIRLRMGWRIPEYQFDGKGLIPGFDEVIGRLDPELHPVAVLRWFTSPHVDLESPGRSRRLLSPRDWLRSGLAAAAVAELAEGI